MEKTDGIVFKSFKDSVPPGALRISKREAEIMQWELVHKWSPTSEVWPLRFGHMITAGFTAVTSLFITSYYRKRLKLGSFGRYTTQIPSVLMPSIVSTLTNFQFVTLQILTQDECPVCIQMRSAALQVCWSVIAPAVVAPPLAFAYASRFGQYELPEFALKNVNEYLKLYWKFTYNYRRTFAVFIAGNALLATYLTYLQGHTYYKMQMKIINDRLALEETINKKLEEANMLK